jgi:hypothetical protein
MRKFVISAKRNLKRKEKIKNYVRKIVVFQVIKKNYIAQTVKTNLQQNDV